MVINDLLIRIGFLFLPGIIAFIVIERLNSGKEIKFFKSIIYSFILGFICYGFYNLLMSLIKLDIYYKCSFFSILSQGDIKEINFNEILLVSVIAVFIGYIATYLIRYKILHKIAHLIKASSKFGDQDVWSYIMNSKSEDLGWVVIRDIKNNLVYEGWISAFSDGSEKDEIFLKFVKVYQNSTGDFYYKVPALYLSTKKENLIFEFPKINNEKNNLNKEDDKNGGR